MPTLFPLSNMHEPGVKYKTAEQVRMSWHLC